MASLVCPLFQVNRFCVYIFSGTYFTLFMTFPSRFLLGSSFFLVLTGCLPSEQLTDEQGLTMTQQYFEESLADPDTVYEKSSEEFKAFMTLDSFKASLEMIPYVAYEDFLLDRVRNTSEYVTTSKGDGMASVAYVYGEMVVTDSLNVPTNIQWIYDEGEARWEVAGVNVTNPYTE